jgi:inner membrane protein
MNACHMATAITHVVVAVGIGVAMGRPVANRRVWLVGAACAVLPDLEVLGFWFGIPYGHPLGHRGLTHSLAFAAGLAAFIVAFAFRIEPRRQPWSWLFSYLFLATASHGVLDAITDGGLGIAFFAPLDNARYLFPLRPIPAAPLDVVSFFTRDGLIILMHEVVWIWLPALLLAGAAYGRRRPGSGLTADG